MSLDPHFPCCVLPFVVCCDAAAGSVEWYIVGRARPILEGAGFLLEQVRTDPEQVRRPVQEVLPGDRTGDAGDEVQLSGNGSGHFEKAATTINDGNATSAIERN